MSIKFDKIIVAPCAVQSADNPVDCTVPGQVEPPVCDDLDICCADPAFAAEHPEECANRTHLILKPEFVSKPVLQEVQYKTFLVNSLGQETELTTGLVYSVADNTIGIIGSASGNLTTLVEGVTTVRVTWQNLSAQAQLNVVAECADSRVGMVLVIDNSKSMNQQFSAGYSTKLSYAKTLARRFAGEINTTKDKIGLVSFSDAGHLVTALTNDINTVKADIITLASTQNKTDLNDGLKVAIEHLETQTVDRRVLIVFSDGAKNDGEDPLGVAQAFKDAGGLIIVVGVRAFGVGFATLQKVSSAGFLLNSYNDTNDDENSDFLSGMKGYFCAGNCVPEGDLYKAVGQLSYHGFKEWDVDGDVDLIGEGLYDFLPGHGLYVDMAGSGAPWKGSLLSKRNFTLDAATTYRLQFRLAGNQRVDMTPYTVRVTVGTLFTQDITITDWQQPFTLYSYDIVGDASIGNKVRFELIDTPGLGAEPYGPLLDDIRFDRITAPAALLLFDSFDTENEQYVPPGCGEPPVAPPVGKQLINIKAAGPTWIARNFRTGGWYSSALKSDGALIYVGEFGGKIVKSADSGSTWSNTTAPDYFWRALACANDGVKVLGVGTPAAFSGSSDVQVYVSTDSGGTWTGKTVEVGYGWSGGACDTTGAKMVVVAMPGPASGLGYLYTSVDTGANWTRRDAAGTVGWSGVAMSSDGTKIVASYLGAPGSVKISTNSGVAWSETLIAGAGYLRDIRMTGDGTKIVCCDDEFIYKSIDGGTTFTKLVVGTALTAYPWVRLAISDDGTKIVAGSVDQLHADRKLQMLALSVDGGVSWRRKKFGSPFWMVGITRNGLIAIAGASFGQILLANSVALDPLNVKNGAAVVGSPGDYWNEWSGETPLQTTIVPDPMFYADGGVNVADPDLLMSQLTGGYDWAAEVTGTQLDALMRRYLKTPNFTGPGDWKQCDALTYFGNSANGCRYVKISGIPSGNWDFYIYGHGDANNENSRFRLTTDFETSSLDQTAEGSGMAGTWLQGVHYLKFERVHVAENQAVYLFLLPPSGNSGGIQYNIFQGIQIKWVTPPVLAPSSSDGCYGTGCLDEPPPEQKPDPSPQPDIEG